MTYARLVAIYLLLIAISLLVFPGRDFTEWCWTVAGISVAWLGVTAFMSAKGRLRR